MAASSARSTSGRAKAGSSASPSATASTSSSSSSSASYTAPSSLTASLAPSGRLVDVDSPAASLAPQLLAPSSEHESQQHQQQQQHHQGQPHSSSTTSTGKPNSKTRNGTSKQDVAAASALAASAGGIGGDNGNVLISRPASRNETKVKVDLASLKDLESRSLYSRPPLEDEDLLTTEAIFAHRGGAPPYGNFNLYRRVRYSITQLIANSLSSGFLILIVIWALSVRFLAQLPRLLSGSKIVDEVKEWDDAKRYGKESLVKDVRYYARSCGFEIVNETAETKDGYYLRMHRVIDPQRAHEKHSDGKGGFPVLIMHGLFQSSGSFVTSEERSLAFWLARHGGYQVFLGNNRGVFNMGHKTLSRSDPRFWDYNIRELAVYDLPAMVDWVRKETGYDKIGFIGHSQGNGTAFISLSQGMVPEMGEKLTYFGALAPAVYAGPLTSCFPFTTLGTMEWKAWRRFFGVLDFIPLMRVSYDWTPAYPYALLGYQMFAFLFAWTDVHWLERRKAKMFRFTPQPVSSTSIYWWAGKGGFASRGCILNPNSQSPWWDSRFPPLSIYSGGMDFLVLTDPLIERLETIETEVPLIRHKRLSSSEHCDFFWAADAVEWCFHDILEDIESTRTLYPEEVANGNQRNIVVAPGVEDRYVDDEEEEEHQQQAEEEWTSRQIEMQQQ